MFFLSFSLFFFFGFRFYLYQSYACTSIEKSNFLKTEIPHFTSFSHFLLPKDNHFNFLADFLNIYIFISVSLNNMLLFPCLNFPVFSVICFPTIRHLGFFSLCFPTLGPSSYTHPSLNIILVRSIFTIYIIGTM